VTFAPGSTCCEFTTNAQVRGELVSPAGFQ
jgi:hypothetical protein